MKQISLVILLIGIIVGILILTLITNRNKNPMIEKGKKSNEYKAKQAIKATYQFIDIESYSRDGITIKTEQNKREFVTGIKIMPKSISLEATQTQDMIIEQLRLVYNQLKIPTFHAYVYAAPDITEHKVYLRNQLEQIQKYIDKRQEDLEKSQTEYDFTMIQEDIQKHENAKKIVLSDIQKDKLFENNFVELNFYVTLRHKNQFQLNQYRDDLLTALMKAGFNAKPFTQLDYDVYLSSIFENELILNYTYSTFRDVEDAEKLL